MKRRTLRLLVIVMFGYAVVCLAAGIFIAEGTLHPVRRTLPPEAKAAEQQFANSLDASLEDVTIPAADSVPLSAWIIRPSKANGDAVILLHGLGDNRLGMNSYAQLLLRHGYSVLLPDARAQGASGGNLATYGLLESHDIHAWFDWLLANEHPHCIFGLGESMGAAQLLQALPTEPRFCAVAAESSFSTFREIAYDRMGQHFHTGPWLGRSFLWPVVEAAFIYTRWKYGLDMRQLSPEDAVAATQVPVFLIHGQLDSNIPVRHSERIHARRLTLFWAVPNAEHRGAISTAPQLFEKFLLIWFQSHRASSAAPARAIVGGKM